MEINAKLLVFDQVSKNGTKYGKDCIKNLNESLKKIPLVDNFTSHNIIGNIEEITKDDTKIKAKKINITDQRYKNIIKELVMHQENNISIAPVFGDVEYHIDGDIKVIDSCNITEAFITNRHSFDDCKIELIDDTEE